ncbi:MAG: hypothetical protein LBU85_01220 [Treponema sp.]|jgi:hypothetical protein|nr:hypothetical protein [Treponema sp.]
MKYFFLAFPALLLVLFFVSCTSVSFEVEHPPIVDLRNVHTITVIPFEWNGDRKNERLSRCATSALINGLRMGKIKYVDPYVLENISAQNYREYADVYITGRITGARTSRNIETREETYWNNYSGKHENETIRVTIITTTVEIEYSYIRSADNAVLGRFTKSETHSGSYEQPERRNDNRRSNRNPGMRGTDSGFRRQGRGLDTGTAEAAIANFSYTMSHELGPFTTTEKRNVKGGSGNNRRAAEADRLIRQDRYEEALAVYSGIYEQNLNAAAGYNTAILLAACEKYADALKLLTELKNREENAGKKSPSFIKSEIKKLTEFINGFKILETYKKNGTVSSANIPPAAPRAASGRITGTANVGKAEIYALNAPISSASDSTVFTKLAAYTSTNNGQWSMDIPDGGPASLWFLLIEEGRYFYISKTPLNISAAVVLDIALMNRLEDK